MWYTLVHNWNIRRVLYGGLGVAIIIQSVLASEYWGIPLGLYLAAMGLFGLGCAGGNCAVSTSDRGGVVNNKHLENN